MHWRDLTSTCQTCQRYDNKWVQKLNILWILIRLEKTIEKYSGWRQRVAQIGKKSSKWQHSFFSSHELVWAHADEQFSPSALWKCNSCPQEFGIFGCFLDPIKDHVVLLSASITFLCEGQNILNALNRTIAFPREDRCGKYFVIQLVCELQSSRQYNTPQRYGGLIALSWIIYKFKRVCSKCRYVIMKLSKEIERDISSNAKVAEIVFVGSPRGAAPLRPRESRPEEHRRRIFPPVGSWS